MGTAGSTSMSAGRAATTNAAWYTCRRYGDGLSTRPLVRRHTRPRRGHKSGEMRDRGYHDSHHVHGRGEIHCHGNWRHLQLHGHNHGHEGWMKKITRQPRRRVGPGVRKAARPMDGTGTMTPAQTAGPAAPRGPRERRHASPVSVPTRTHETHETNMKMATPSHAPPTLSHSMST